ncbi:MAG TPA: type II toxin-antitoxin system PemK/MazF family toxin [Candidatus Lokiarchaeia archaeon]|nr:type II toxin-antitoxin system PemK/MazF family toxin [Candidatus Lokiarchaeia archaeon]
MKFKSGDVVLVPIQFTDSDQVKRRPGVILFEEHDNVVIAGVTSNLQMDGITLTMKEGAIKESIIKLNYLFTISAVMIEKVLFSLTSAKRELVYDSLVQKLAVLIENNIEQQ